MVIQRISCYNALNMSLFNYIVILGRQPEFGLAELESLLGATGMQPFGYGAALVSGEVDVARLGGAVKVGRVLYRGKVALLRDLPIEVDALPVGSSKTPFALSAYGLRMEPRALKAVGLELKKRLRARGSVRLVAPGKGLAVSAAELRHNRVVEDGFELLAVAAGDEMVVAQTTGVQDIDWYSERDYGRPGRSAKVGMLPPKLAQVLVNTTAAPVVADPFCGTGVVLLEALLAGRAAAGSDVAPDMVAATRENLAWLAGRPEAPAPLPASSVEQADARGVGLPDGCALVSEGYLGPNLSFSPALDRLKSIKVDILALYRDSLANWAKQLPSGAEVTLCVPAWRIGKNWSELGLVDELPRLGYTLKRFRHVRTPLLYAREGQVVGRQVLFLRKA